MKRIIYTLALAAFCAGLGSCIKDSNAAGEQIPAEETLEPGFSGATRLDGSGYPTHGDAYTLMSYLQYYANITTVNYEQIRNSNYMRQYGYYAYDATGTVGAAGDLIPIPAVTAATQSVATIVRTPSQGQRLEGVPVSGTNTTHKGYYHTAVLHPAVPVYDAGELGWLAVFERTDTVYASDPDDKNGDGNENDPFEIVVKENMDVFDASGVIMYPIRASINIYLYSHFYPNDDPITYPSSSKSFTINSLSLINAGSNGWFNARTELIYPNYNYSKKSGTNVNYKTRYSSTVGVDNVGDNAEPLAYSANTDFIPTPYKDGTGTTINANAMYKVSDVPVFPTDYRGGESGGSSFIIPMTLSLSLDSGGETTAASVPLSIVIERNKSYTFYVNVKSEQIIINYSKSAWTSAGGTYDPVGGDLELYPLITINKGDAGWIGKDTGMEDIGN